jgi:hypothetical protein
MLVFIFGRSALRQTLNAEVRTFALFVSLNEVIVLRFD